MRVVLLGAPVRIELDSWKNDIADAGTALGWDVTHLHARGIPTEDVVRACRGADLMIWARTHGYDPKGDATAMLRRIEDAGTVTAGIHLDLYWTLPGRIARVGNQPWWSCQHVFTADGGHQEEFAARGVNHYWCPPPIGIRWLGRGEPDPSRFARYAFVGSCVSSIHGRHRTELLRWAKRRYKRQFMRYGNGSRRVDGHDLNTLYATAHVVFGDSAPADCYWSDRVPRTLGRGGLLAYPNTVGLAEQGFTSEHMLLYDRFNFSNLAAQVDALTDARRREMTDAALTLIEERHTWPVRLREIEGVVFGCA